MFGREMNCAFRARALAVGAKQATTKVKSDAGFIHRDGIGGTNIGADTAAGGAFCGVNLWTAAQPIG